MKTKPDMGFWGLWNLSFGFFGVQIAYALQSANVSRIFATIGADPHDLSYFWILPPLMGLIVQPLVGSFSDRTWNRFGRRLPYLIFGAIIAVAVMCLLPNAGSFGLSISSAILFGVCALMLLDTSINMAMQPFKMLVGDMVNEKQKGKAYSIQSLLCNAGSVVGYIFPFCLAWFGLRQTAPDGVVPPTVIWSFYLGAAILMLCVIYSLIKIKEWPPHVYNEYNGISEQKETKKSSSNLFTLLAKAPKTFWTVSIVQFFCWFAFLFMWTYTNGTVAYNAFNTPEVEKIIGISDSKNTYNAKYILANDSILLVKDGRLTYAGINIDGEFVATDLIIRNNKDTLIASNFIYYGKDGLPVLKQEAQAAIHGDIIQINGNEIEVKDQATVIPTIETLKGATKLTTAAIMAKDHKTGKLVIEDAESITIPEISKCEIKEIKDLNTASLEYSEAGNWVGILFAIQAIGSVIWATILPRFRSRRFSYILSLILGGIGFILAGILTNKYMLFIPFLLIGCAWAAMLAWPFTILTNSLKGGNIGAYLGLFNCSICIPQIVGALAGGWILGLFSTPAEVAPQYIMMIIAGISLFLGAVSVLFIKEKQ